MSRFYPGRPDEAVTDREIASRAVARRAAAEGMVLMENNGVLPFAPGARLALYGVGARHTIKGGTGSGDVNSRDVVSVDAGLRAAGFDIVNTAWLDAFDEAYDAAREQWIRDIYASLDGERDAMKLYEAHVRTKLREPELPIRPEDAEKADALVFVISRTSGEAADRREVPGDYYLAEEEERRLRELCTSGKPVVVLLNVGGIIDLGFLDELPVAALVLIGQPGCEGGNAAADVLSGKVSPSGRLTDTWARNYPDYPSSGRFSHRDGNLLEEFYTDGIYVGYRFFDTFGVKPRYPFGWGLSYTRFERETGLLVAEGAEVRLPVTVRNTGAEAGRETVLLYASCPNAGQKKEYRRLAAFAKTRVLDPGEEQTLELRFALEGLASWRTGIASWVLEKGRYTLLTDGPDGERAAAVLTLGRTVCVSRPGNVCGLLDSLTEIEPSDERVAELNTSLKVLAEGAPEVSIDGAAAGLESRQGQGKARFRPEDPLFERAAELTAKMTREQKIAITVGTPSGASADMIGGAAVTVPGAAGETVSFPELGIPAMVLADGPAGLRLQKRYEIDPATGRIWRLDRFETMENRFFGRLAVHEGMESRWQFATAIPTGTLLAQTFDTELLEEVGGVIAREMKEFRVSVWLAPGMNIHRNPLCGRNFEYFSEDPFLSGATAAAITRGVQASPGLGVTIKHYACNNQEDNRMGVTANVSERALREIYLRGFEIAVRTAQPVSIMTSYNRINSVHAANSYDLCTRVAREEWGFEGFIMTDWTTTNSGHGSSAAKCILAGNDLVMPGTENDRREIREALSGEGHCILPPERLDESVTRLVYAALKSMQAEDR